MGFIRKVIYTALIAGAINYGINSSINGKIYSNNDKIRHYTELITYSDPENATIKEAETVINKTKKLHWYTPFFDALHIKKAQNELLTRLENNPTLSKYEITLGIANDKGLSLKDNKFKKEIDEAKVKLNRYGLSISDIELLDIYIPTVYDEEELFKSIQTSFSKPKKFCLILTDGDYYEEKDDYNYSSKPNMRIAMTDRDFDDRNLDDLIVQEIMRYVQSEPQIKGIFKHTKYDQISKKKIVDRLSEIKIQDYDVKTNMDKKRILELNVGLDDMDEKLSTEIINAASERFNKEFNIELKINGMYSHKLSGSWSHIIELSKIREESKNKSDIYLLFTSNDWKDTGDGPFGSVCGQASPYHGWCWIETYDKQMAIDVLCHEITHLFDVNHDYRDKSIMQASYDSDDIQWTNYAKSIILKNKFKKWEWSK